MTDVTELWATASGIVRNQISDGVWQSTFSTVEPLRADDGAITLVVPNAIVREKLDGRFRPLVEDAIAEAAGLPLSIDFEVRTPTLFDAAPDHLGEDASVLDLTDRTSADDAGPEVVFPTAEPPTDAAADGLAIGDVGQRYTFETFVIGGSNRFAHAAALSVAERPGGSYNPLFIYGPAGLGKTHLLRAIESYVNDVYPQLRVTYVSTETFLNDFVESIKNSDGADFKQRYRRNDVLLVDDVQFFAGRDGLQEEFFHTFNDLYGGNRQIVLSSDRSPEEIPTLEVRLKTRFMMGLLTDIQPPEVETRMAILQKRAERDGYFLPSEVCEFIATNITNNIRELEGALNKVTAYANLNSQPMTRELAEQILTDFIADRGPKPITISLVLDVTTDEFDVSHADLVGRSRRKPLVGIRQMAMYVTRELTELSYPTIAREFGGRDHTTVMHACDKIGTLMRERAQVYKDVTRLERAVRNAAKAS